MKCSLPVLVTAVALMLAPGQAPAADGAGKQMLAFPGAEGYGKHTVGGRGGKVVRVTNLNASGEGSFTWAVNEVKGPRTIVFDVAGVIDLKNKGGFQIGPDNSNVTIAGETSPGGIAVYNYQQFRIGKQAEQVIMRFIRLRGTTINTKSDPDGIGIWDGRHVIIDQCSIAGSCDETVSTTGLSGEVTVQWTGFDESRKAESHGDFYNKDSKGQWHNYGGIFSPKSGPVTVHHSLFAHHSKRNPLAKGEHPIEFINNVVYNYSNDQQVYAAEGEGAHIIHSYYKLGPDMRNKKNSKVPGPAIAKDDVPIIKDCVSYGQDGTSPGPAAENRGKVGKLNIDTLDSAQDCYEKVLARAGALPHDATSRRMVEETRKGTGRQGYDAKIEDDIAALQAYPAPADSDRDGMPDAWEQANGLNKDDASDAVKVTASGYTNLEVYCHYLAERLIAGHLPWKDDPKVVGR